MEKIKIKHVGFDSWDREVFQTQKGTYVVDIRLGICSGDSANLLKRLFSLS